MKIDYRLLGTLILIMGGFITGIFYTLVSYYYDKLWIEIIILIIGICLPEILGLICIDKYYKIKLKEVKQ